MSTVVEYLSELKRVDDALSRIASEVNDSKDDLSSRSLEILEKCREEMKVDELENGLDEIKEDLKRRRSEENQRIFESGNAKLLLLRDKAQQMMDELVETTLEMILGSG